MDIVVTLKSFLQSNQASSKLTKPHHLLDHLLPKEPQKNIHKNMQKD